MVPVAGERHISGVYTKLLVGFLDETMSSHQIQQLLARAGDSRGREELANAGSWSSYSQFRRLLEERARIDPATLYGRSRLLSDWLATWELSQVAQTFDSPGALLAGGSALNPLVPIRRYDKTEVGPNEWTIREWFEDGYPPFPEFCDFAAIQYAVIPAVFKLPPGDVVEEECQCRGDAACLFRLRWQHFDTDASKTDRYRIRAEQSEAQLQQIQDMIANLASNERYEDVLQGFVRSALRTAVGAGGALLALEGRPGSPRQVYFEGLAEAEAESIADGLLDRTIDSNGIVAVDVTSGRRHYGVLAIDEGGGVFSSLSQSTLETHARLTAAALDTADALEEARHQANTAQVLLHLATSLTEIVSTEEMAAKVAQAVPDIIDCDRAAVFLDTVGLPDACPDGFRLVGSSGYSPAELAAMSSRMFQVAPPDWVVEQGIVQGTYGQSRSVASVSAPIVVTGETIGSIVASVTHRPERLTVTPRLADRLKGLAAQASTAIANARLVDQIRFQAAHDALTGLPNRALIIDRTEQMLARARRSETQVAALFIDLDGFKDVNDSLGHGIGDQLLQSVSERLELIMRESDTIGRLGGDEFVVLVDGSTMDIGPEMVAERLLDALRAPFELPGLPGSPLLLTASIGIATGVRSSATELLRDADIALYQAKSAGKNCVVAFESEMHAVVQDRHLLEMDLRDALEMDQYRLVYQPIFKLAGGQTTGVEALLRWDHPHRGLVQPDTFIPILEGTGLIREVGRWVLNEACRQGARWHVKGYRLDVSVNVSARQLEAEQLIEDVRLALLTSGLPAASLTLEITETAIMKDVAAVVPRLAALKATGVRIAIDDFGTGYSSLAYLQQFPIDTLKIDRSFISAMAESPESAALVRTLVQLGKALGLETLAEGIEELDQYSQLEREQCDSGQGYLYARPLDVEAVETFLAARTFSDRESKETGAPLPR
jgi:diguanylate cyclase (GGDEF)-like protein